MNKKPDDEKLWAEFRKYFGAFVVSDIEKALNAGIEVGVIILTAIGIDCLSGYYAGRKTDRKLFVKFMKNFMPAYAAHADDIYNCVRSGLAHDYIIKRNSKTNRTFVFSRDTGEPHLAPTTKNPNVIYLNRETFARDFLKAQHEYFEKAENDQKLWDKALRRLIKRGFITVRPEDELVARIK
jgi:hypothetical protein